jgi:hypothetical protein
MWLLSLFLPVEYRPVKLLSFTLRLFLFWMLFFAFLRIVFMLYNQAFIHTENISNLELLQVFWQALPVDIATASYILVLPVMILFLGLFLPGSWVKKLSGFTVLS